jgi:hypothetical protein
MSCFSFFLVKAEAEVRARDQAALERELERLGAAVRELERSEEGVCLQLKESEARAGQLKRDLNSAVVSPERDMKEARAAHEEIIRAVTEKWEASAAAATQAEQEASAVAERDRAHAQALQRCEAAQAELELLVAKKDRLLAKKDAEMANRVTRNAARMCELEERCLRGAVSMQASEQIALVLKSSQSECRRLRTDSEALTVGKEQALLKASSEHRASVAELRSELVSAERAREGLRERARELERRLAAEGGAARDGLRKACSQSASMASCEKTRLWLGRLALGRRLAKWRLVVVVARESQMLQRRQEDDHELALEAQALQLGLQADADMKAALLELELRQEQAKVELEAAVSNTLIMPPHVRAKQLHSR